MQIYFLSLYGSRATRVTLHAVRGLYYETISDLFCWTVIAVHEIVISCVMRCNHTTIKCRASSFREWTRPTGYMRYA